MRHIGVSNETSFGVNEFANVAARHGLPKIVSIQNVYNLLCRVRYETDLAETCPGCDVQKKWGKRWWWAANAPMMHRRRTGDGAA